MASHLLVGNPTAQSGKNEGRLDAAMRALEAVGIRAELLSTLPDGRTVGAVKDALDAASFEVVIAMGGDGTFREVASGLMMSGARERTALAMLPTGTANDQGRSFGLDASDSSLPKNVDVIRSKHETRLDAGVIRSAETADFFFDSAAWGLSARVLAKRNEDRRAVEQMGVLKEIYRDHAVYVGAFVKTFLESFIVDDTFAVTGMLDDQPFALDGLTDLVIKNTRVFAGAWVLDPSAKHDDGAFELVPFRGKLDWASKAIVDLEVVPLTEQGLNKVGIEHSKPMRASRMQLSLLAHEGGAPLMAQIDGEEWPSRPGRENVVIEVIPRALRLIVPGGDVPR